VLFITTADIGYLDAHGKIAVVLIHCIVDVLNQAKDVFGTPLNSSGEYSDIHEYRIIFDDFQYLIDIFEIIFGINRKISYFTRG